MKKTILVLGIELLVVIVIALGVLFVFKIPPFNASLPSLNLTTPINASANGVQTARIIYTLKSQVKELKPSGDFYLLTLTDYPNQNITISKSMLATVEGQTSHKQISSVKPGETITILVIYDLKAHQWVAIPTVTNFSKNSPTIPQSP